MIQYCKYRLPCAWCEKYDRECLVVKYENEKQEQEKKLSSIKCDHEWNCYKTVPHTGGTDYYYRCNKCGALKLKSSNGYTYKCDEWQP